MLDLIDQAMCSLQAALFGREVYSREHPAVREHIESAHDHLIYLHLIRTVNRLNEMLNPMMRFRSSWDLVYFVQDVKLIK